MQRLPASQETGLTFNSWYGKFHIEMHWWHAVILLYGAGRNTSKISMDWYFGNLENARNTAQLQGYDGVRWQKMTTPEGLSSPSSVGEFLVWQQPHPIYFSELLYRSDPSLEHSINIKSWSLNRQTSWPPFAAG